MRPNFLLFLFFNLCICAFALAQEKIELPSPFVLDGQYQEEVNIFIVDGKYYLKKDKLSAILRDKVTTEIFNEIQSFPEEVEINKVEISGLKISYSEETLSLNINILPSHRKTNELSIYNLPYHARSANALSPEPFSGYVNLRTSSNFTQGAENSSQFSTEFETVLNFKKWVYESQVDYNDEREQLWQSFRHTLTHDDEDHAVRYSLGDLTYSTVGLQSFNQFAGLSVSKKFAIQPYKITNPVGNQRFFLRQASKVRILLNGQIVKELNLPAGEQNIRDLPLARGLNNIVIEIEDSFGRVERIDATQLSEAELLRPDVQEFTYNAGINNPQTGFDRTYDKESPRYSLFHRFGLPRETTLGYNFQGSDEQWMGGAEMLWGSPIGFWALDIASSDGLGFQPDLAGRLRYRLTRQSLKSRFSWSWAWDVNYLGRRFASLGSTAPNNSTEWSYSTTITLPYFIDSLRTTLGFNYDQLRDNLRNRKEVLFQANYFGFRGHQITLELASGENEFARENRVFVNWIWTGTTSKNFFLSSYESVDNSISLETHKSYHPSVGQVDVTASARSSEARKSIEGSVDYFNQRMLILADFDRFFGDESNNIDSQAQLTFGSAVAFAGGRWTISRPIVDSFALLSAKPHLNGQKIPINSQGDYTEAEIGTWKTAVLPNLTAYHYHPVFLDPSHLTEGFGLEEENLLLKPSFRSGFSLTVGTDASVFAVGQLYGPNLQPLSLSTGRLSSLQNPQKSHILFTNRKGEFYIEGLKSGDWTLTLDNPRLQPFQFTVKPEKTGKHDLGRIKIKEVE